METKIFRLIAICETETEVMLVDDILEEQLAAYSGTVYGRLEEEETSYETRLYVDGLTYEQAVAVKGELDGAAAVTIVVRSYATPGMEVTQQGYIIAPGGDSVEVWVRLRSRVASDLSGIHWHLLLAGKSIKGTDIPFDRSKFELIRAEIEVLSVLNSNPARRDLLIDAITYAVDSAISKSNPIMFDAQFEVTVDMADEDLGVAVAAINNHHGIILELDEVGDKTQLMAHIAYDEALRLKQEPLFAEATLTFVKLTKAK